MLQFCNKLIIYIFGVIKLKIKRILMILVFSLLINFIIWMIFGTKGVVLQYLVPILSFVFGLLLFKKYFTDKT